MLVLPTPVTERVEVRVSVGVRLLDRAAVAERVLVRVADVERVLLGLPVTVRGGERVALPVRLGVFDTEWYDGDDDGVYVCVCVPGDVVFAESEPLGVPDLQGEYVGENDAPDVEDTDDDALGDWLLDRLPESDADGLCDGESVWDGEAVRVAECVAVAVVRAVCDDVEVNRALWVLEGVGTTDSETVAEVLADVLPEAEIDAVDVDCGVFVGCCDVETAGDSVRVLDRVGIRCDVATGDIDCVLGPDGSTNSLGVQDLVLRVEGVTLDASDAVGDGVWDVVAGAIRVLDAENALLDDDVDVVTAVLIDDAVIDCVAVLLIDAILLNDAVAVTVAVAALVAATAGPPTPNGNCC